MGGRQPLRIPFPSKDPRYFKCWNLIKKQGLSLDAALERMGVSPPPDTAAGSIVEDPLDTAKKRHVHPKNGNGKVTAEDLLGHPGVPDRVKEQLLVTLENNSAPLHSSAQEESTTPLQGPPAFVVPTTREQIPAILSVLTRIADSLEKPAVAVENDSNGNSPALNPHLARWLQRVCTDFERQNETQINIATALEAQLKAWNRLCNDLESINDTLAGMSKNLAATRWSH